MTDISIKHRVITLISFAFAAVVLSLCNFTPFSLVFFACSALVLFFADRILNSGKIKERTASAFFVFAACYQTFFQIFNRAHEINTQLMIAAAVALFLAGTFAATSEKNLPYSIFAAAVITFLDKRIAFAYCLMLLTFSIVKLQLEKCKTKSGKKKKSKNKKDDKNNNNSKFDPVLLNTVSIIVCIICLVFCIIPVFRNEPNAIENIDYALQQFKSIVGFLLLIIYLLIRLLRSEIKAKISIIVGFFLNVAFIPLYFIHYGWSLISLLLISTSLFLALVCLENEDISNSIKDDYHNHKYIFFAELILLLQ